MRLLRLPAFAATFTVASLAALTPLPVGAQASADTPYAAVHPLIGTTGDGNTFPGASLPFGMMQWSPDTSNSGWYFYPDKKLYGFSLTHLSGAGCPLYGDFAVLPTAAELTTSPGTDITPYTTAFTHNHEEAHPGTYAITLENGIRVEIAVSDRAGIARFHFPAGQPARLLINAGSSANTTRRSSNEPAPPDTYNAIELAANNAFAGQTAAGGFCGSTSSYKLYVHGAFEQPYKTSALWHDDSVAHDAKTAQGRHTGAWLDFGDTRDVVLKVGISFVSLEGAAANLEKEIPGWDYDAVASTARTRWSELLERFAVEGGTSEQRTIFYTGVYHSFLAPNLFSDEDGSYMGFDNKVHALAGSKQKAQYANFSDWDTYRNTVQLQALFEPERESDMNQSLVNDAAQSGWYPRWPAANDVTYVMNGDSPVIVLASSYAFGARNFDTAAALKYMIKAGTEPGMGPHNNSERPFLEDYRKLGYVPVDKDTSAASRTLEYASDDFAIAEFARATGDQAHYQAFLKQSLNWKNLFDPETRWIRPRKADGSWLQGFDADKSLPKRPDAPVSTDQLGFEEGNTYQYTFMIPFDYPELFRSIGGDAKVEPRLDKFFSKLICWGEPCFNMANEPDFVTPYAYTFAGMPWKTQEVVTRIAKETFKTSPDGIPGNDDLGATSGVYVWNALGFYPAVPGVGGLVLGAPMFDKATLRLAGDRTLVIERKGNGAYVRQATLNGSAYSSTWLPVDKLAPGTTTLTFHMDEQPNKQRGAAAADRPPSFR